VISLAQAVLDTYFSDKTATAKLILAELQRSYDFLELAYESLPPTPDGLTIEDVEDLACGAKAVVSWSDALLKFQQGEDPASIIIENPLDDKRGFSPDDHRQESAQSLPEDGRLQVGIQVLFETSGPVAIYTLNALLRAKITTVGALLSTLKGEYTVEGLAKAKIPLIGPKRARLILVALRNWGYLNN